MQDFASFDWDDGTEKDHVMMVRTGTPSQIRELAQTYDWGQHPVSVLGWVMAQKGIDLGTALNVFQNAKPLQYNYIGKRDVPAAHRGMCRLLDNICQRINCGFYLPEQGSGILREDKMHAWVRYQQDDAAEGRVGRWVLDAEMVNTAFALTAPEPDAHTFEEDTTGFGFIDALVKPFREQGLSKRFRMRA